MASDIRIPDPVTIKKQEDEDSYLINEQADKIQKEIYKMEEEKLDLLINQPPGVGDFPSSVDTIDAELNDGIKTKDNEILVTSHSEQVENEEKCRSDPCPTSIPKEDETEMLDNEKQFHKCDHTGDAKEKEEYEAVLVDETCENSIQKIDEQEALHDVKTSSPMSKVEEDIIVEKEESSNDEINVDQNVEEIIDQQTFVDNNYKPQNIHEERNGSELELKKEASAESTINILNDDIETVTTNAEDSPCSHGILDEEDGGIKTELKVGDCTEISCDSKVEKVIETSRDTDLEKNEEPSTSNADHASDVAMPEVQNDETTTEIGISAEGKQEMLSVSEDTDEGSKQEGTLEEGVNLNRPSDEFTNQTETREESTHDNGIPNKGDEAEFSEQKLDSINVERQVDLQEMTESTTNESREVEELTATATGDYIDGSQNSKAVQDLEHKYFEENDPAEETTLVAVNKGLEENETETPRENSETISNEGEKQITNLEKTSSGIEKEHIEAAYFGASKDDVPTEEELSPSNLNEVHDCANELSDNNGNDVQLERSLLQETEKVEDQKVDEVLEFENEQKIQEENNAMTEEEKYVDNVSEAYPNTEHTIGEIESLDKTVTNEMISEINSTSVEDEKISGSGLEEKIESSEIRVYVPEELESTEDTETSVQRSTIKDSKTEEQIAVDDALTTESRNVDEEIVEKSFEEQDYEEATLNLSGEDENLSPNEIEKKKTYDEEGSDNIDTENIKEEALIKSKDACFSPETNEVDGSSEKEVETLREEDSGRSILDEADEKYAGEEVIKHYEDENEDIEISKGEIFCEVENVTGEKFITNEKNKDVETQEDVAFSEEHDLLATKEASMEESRNDSTCPTKEVVADNAIDNTTKNSERQAMVAEEVADKVLDEGKSKEEPVNFLVARESETETLSENDQIISGAEKDIKQIKQKDDSGGELMQPLVIDEAETEVLRQNAYNETLAVEELEETKQTETEACFDSTVVAEKDTEKISQIDETSEEVKQLEFTNEIEEKASCDNAENETSVARDDVEQISHQEETKEELEQSLETKKIETEASCRDAEIIKLEDYTEKDLLNEVTKESEASCGDIEITVPKEDAEQVLLKEAANDIVQPQAPNETEKEVFSENVKEILAVEELQDTKTILTEASSDSTKVADEDAERSLEKVETSEEVQQLQLTNEVEEKTFCDDAEEILVAREDTAQILHQDEPKKELDHSGETQKIEFEEQCEDEEVIAPEEDTQPVVLKEVTKELDQSLVTNENEMDAFSGNSEIVVNEKDTKQISQNIELVEEFQNVPETEETETEDNNPVIIAKDTENLQKDETRKEVKELLLTSELEAKTISDDDEKETLVAEDYAEKDSETNLQTYETKEEMVELINANDTETEVFHGDVEPPLAEKDIDKICQKNESTEEIEQYLGIKESNTEGFGDSSGIAIGERNFEETLQKEESKEELEQLQASKEIETEAEKVRGNTEIDTVMGERGSEEPFEIGESSEKFEQSIVTPEPAVQRDVDEDIITGIGGEETAKKEVIETARECHENVILDEISSIESQSQETISEEITTKDIQKNENEAIGYKELEIEDVSSIEQENTTGTLSSTPINETITESCEKENSDTVELKQELQLALKEQIEEQNSKEISADKIQMQEDPDTKALDEEIHIEERSENLAQNFFYESKVSEEEMQEEIQEKKKADSSLVSILSEEKISKEELEIKELSNEEGTDLATSSINVEEERGSKSENEKDKDISIVAYETENQIEYETDDQVHPTTIKNDQKVTIDEANLHHAPDYKLTDLSTLPSKELDTETTEASNAAENITIDVAGEDIINEEVENPLKEQEIENKLVQEADESFTQRDLSEMGSSDIVHNSAPSEVPQQRDEELHPHPETENQIEYEADDQVHPTTIKNDQEVIIEEATLHHTPDYKVTDLSSLTSKELDTETTEANNATENVTIDAAGEDIINEEVENPLKEQEIENKLVQEADESFIQRDLSEMGSSDIVHNSAPSEVPQQRDEELHPPPETENQIEYEADDQVHPTTIKNDQEVIIEEATLHDTPDYKVTDLSSLTSKELDTETIEASNATENVTIDAPSEDIINGEVENPLKEQEIENKLVQEADESFTQRDLSEMGSSDIVHNSGPSEVPQQRDEELHPPPETENQIEYEANDQVHPTTIKNDQEVIIEETTLHHTPDYEVTDLSSLTSKELDIETTEASNATENVTIDAEGEDIINEEVDNPLKEQEIENKLEQEADESFTQRDLSEMGSSDIVQSSAPSEVQQPRDEELHPPPEIDRRSTFDSNEVANLNKEELIDFEKQHEVIDDKNYLESEEAGEDETKQILHSEKSEDIEKLLESKITETEAYAAEKDTGEGHQETEVIETARECKENVISDEIDSTKSQSQETVNDEITLEYFQKDGTDAIGYKEQETEHTSLTEQEKFKENITAVLSSLPINETTTESSENENSDALKLKQELQLESEEQIEVENRNELQKDLDTKEAFNEEIHVEERSENVAQNLLSESKVYEAETQEGTQEKENSDSSFVAISGRDLSEMGSDQKSAPSELQKQRDPELHPPPEIDISTSESNEVANLDKEELADFQNQYKVVDDKNNLQTEELEEIIFENQYEVVDDKNKLESEEADKDDSKDILRNEKSTEEIEQLMETKITETEVVVAEKDTREGLIETETSVAEKDTTEVLEHTEPCVVEKDSSASNEMGNLKKEELDFENEYEIVDDKNNLELEGETSKKEEPSEQPNDQYSIGDKPISELNMTCTDFEETSRSMELEEATAAVEVVSQGAGHDDSTVQFNELPTKEVFDTTSTGKEAKEETIEEVDTTKIHSTEITELDTFEKNFEDDQAKETNLESSIQIEATEALNEETSNQASNENYVASFVSEVSDKEVKEVRKDELITDDSKPSIDTYESENSGLNVAESEEKDMVEDKTVLDSTAIDNEPESAQKDITDVGTVLDFSAEERRDKDIEAVVEGKEGGEYEMEEKLGILTEDTCTKEGNENLADFEEEISINDYDSPSAKFGSEDLSLKAPESKEQEAETKEDQSVMEIRPEDISILCKEKEEDTTTLVVKGIDNRDHNIEETTPTKGVVEENILTRSFDFRSDDNLPESVEISSDKHQLVETETAEKVEDIVVRDEASYGNFEPEEKLNNPTEDTCTKEGNENLTASIESKVFNEEIKEEIVIKEEISTSDFDSASTKFESGDLSLKAVESEQKIQTINDQSVMEIKPEDNSILCKENDDEATTLAVERMVNQDHDIEETIPNKVIVEENILTRSFDFTSDRNLQETVEIPSSENQLIASETSDKVEKNIVRDEASYGNFEPEATSPTQTIEEKLDATIEDTCTKKGDENLVASPQSKVPDDEIKELISKEEISINDYDSPSTKFERKDLSLKVVESEEQEIQAKEDQTTIDTKQEDEDIVTLAVESSDNKEHDIEETTSKEVVVDENVLIRSFDSTGDNLQDSAEISSDKHEFLAAETTERVVSEETEHVMDEVHKAVAEEAFLTTSSDTLNDNDCHDSSVVLSEEHLPTASEMIEEKVSKSGIDDSPDKFNELELSKGQVISTLVGKENDIIEQEDGYYSKDKTLDLGEEKAAIVFCEGDQGQRKEVAEIKEKSLLEEKNDEIDDSSETLECATELVNEDQNIQSKMSEAEEDIKQENPASVEQQILEQSQEDEITSTKMEATVTNEKVCDEIIKTDSGENNEEQVIENKSTLEELHMISSQGAVNESCEVSEDYTDRQINSNEKVGTIKSESEEDITSQRETTITDTTQKERVMSECIEPPANISVSIAEESEEKITGEMRNDLEKMQSPSDEATVETPSRSAKAMEADSSVETNAKVAPSLLETQKLMDNPNTSNIPFKISGQASEYEQEVSIDDILSKSKDSEIEEKHQGIAVTSLNTTENEYEKTVEESITTENKVPNEEELEQNKFKEDHNKILLNEDSNKEEVAEEINEPLKSTSEVYYQDVVKLSEVIDEGATETEKAEEHRMLEEVTKKESFTDEENNEYLKEKETEVDTEIQGKTEAITKEKESRVDMSELKGPENSADNNIISKDIYQIKEIAPEISGKKLNQTEEISEEGIKTRSVVGDVSPIVNFSALTEPPIENEGKERQDAREEDREVKEHGDSGKDNLYEVRAEEFISTDLEKVMAAKQKQSAIIENELVDRTMTENTEQTIKSEEHEDEKIEGAHVGDSGTDEEKGDKHDKDAVSDSPVIVEASKDIDVKVGHKKSHNILSGVGSKVKHSISKVKKAITGKSSHHKSEPPK